MKAIYASLALMLSTLAFTAPAAAECVDNPDTGTWVCVTLNPADPQNRDVTATQQGVGGVNHYAYEYSFWGMTYRGDGTVVYTAHDSPVGSNRAETDSFCFVGPDGSCESESRAVSVTTSEHGSVAFHIDSWNGVTSVCYYTDVAGESGNECFETL